MTEMKKEEYKEESKSPEKKDDKEKEAKTYARLDDEDAVIEQCQNEYTLAYKHQQSEKAEDLVRLRLFHNQKKKKDSVGDTTMFSIFQTVLASLYDDRLVVDFRGKEEGDEQSADNLNAMALADYDEMEKDQIDYDLDWDTCFFARGLLLIEDYLRDADNNIFIPLPEVLDPTLFLRDPKAVSVNGSRKGKGAMRFGGLEVNMTEDEMKNHELFYKDIEFKDLKYGAGTYSLLNDAQRARDEAKGNNSTLKDSESNLGVNAEYTITQWWTHVKVNGKVKKVKVWLANDRSVIVGHKVYKRDYWPILDRPLYPTSHTWRGTSIPDLTEDKQRQRAVAQNLGMKAMKADLHPMYIYDSNKITNKNDLNFDFNKGIGIDATPGESVLNAIAPLNKARPNLQLLQFIYESLDASAQKATATPDIKMGMQSGAGRTLGENNLITANVDTRYSLAAKIFGFSEKRFWRMHWYNLYKDNFDEDIDEKVLRIVGAFGSKWRPLSKKDIICRLDPDVYIESKNVSRAKDMEDRTLLQQYFSLAIQDPTVNRRWALKKLAKLNGLPKDEIDRLFPPTIDERIAEDENEILNQDKVTPVKPEDDHNSHLEIHASAKDTTAAKAHIETHKLALSVKKTRPELFPDNGQQETMMNNKDSGGGVVNGANMPKMGGMTGVSPSDTSNQL